MKNAPIEFMVQDHSGQRYRCTTEQLMRRIMENSKWLPFYSWDVPISELVRVTSSPEFPTDQSEHIRYLVIDSFNAIYTHDIPHSQDELAEISAIWQCFHSLRDTNSGRNREVCKTFMERLINCQIRLAEDTLEHRHLGNDYRLFVRGFIKEKISHWQDKKGSALEEWVAAIPDEFIDRITEADRKNRFKKGDDEAWQSIAAAYPQPLKLKI